MAAVHGKWPAGKWSSIQAKAWSTLGTWYAIEELGAGGGKTTATVTARILIRATISAVAQATATMTGRLNIAAAMSALASTSAALAGTLALRAIATMAGATQSIFQGLSEHFTPSSHSVTYATSGALEKPTYVATQDGLSALQYQTKQS